MVNLSLINHIAKYLVISILLAIVIFTVIWLWQRQSKIQTIQTPHITPENNLIQSPEILSVTPQDGAVLTAKKITLKGKANANYLAIFSNEFQTVIKTDPDGLFEKDVNLAEGLNLITLASFSNELKGNWQKSIAFLVADNTKEGETVFAGSLKSILGNLLTISTQYTQKLIRSSQNTTFIFPKSSTSENSTNESTDSAIQNIRIGDYLIAQGNIVNSKIDEISALKIEIIRTNKPQNNKIIQTIKFLSSARQDPSSTGQNIVSAQDLVSNEILEYELTKNTEIMQENNEANIKNITKNKNAIIIYHQEKDENLVDLIYLLP